MHVKTCNNKNSPLSDWRKIDEGQIEEKELRLLFYFHFRSKSGTSSTEGIKWQREQECLYMSRRRRKVARIQYRVTGQEHQEAVLFKSSVLQQTHSKCFHGVFEQTWKVVMIIPHFPLRIWGSGQIKKLPKVTRLLKVASSIQNLPPATISHRLCTGDSFLHLRRSKKPLENGTNPVLGR